MDDLAALSAKALRDGWASGEGDLTSIREQAKLLGWTEVPARRGDPPVTTLKPKSKADAHPGSLSASYGLDAQPLHTDGAHLQVPPDILIFVSQSANKTPTRLWRQPRFGRFSVAPNAALLNGMFLVRDGRESFFAPAVLEGRFRFDPGCMAPCDQRAVAAVRYFAEEFDSAEAFEWPSANRLLVLNNRRTLHARSAMAPGDEGRELSRIAYYRETK